MYKQARLSSWLQQRTPFQTIALFYAGAVTLAVLLLSLPIGHRPDAEFTMLDIIFTSVSAVSVTGLSTISIVDTFNEIGVFFLAFVLQFGGIGIMTLGTFIWLLIGKKIGLKERQLIMADQNQTSFQGVVKLIKGILSLVLLIELLGFLILSTYFLRYFPTWQEAFYQGFFASVSATTNAGFDITGQSLIPFSNDYFVQFIHILLIILGAIGFPVLIEVKQYLFSSVEDRKFMRFSLFTKVTTFTYFVLVIVGFVLLLVMEWNHFYADKTWHEKVFYSLFQSTTSRSGGLSTMDVSLYTEQSQLVLTALMFIGGSPSSVGGGIRTTTFALVIIFILTFARGSQNVSVFRREIHHEDLFRAVVVTLMAIITYFIAVVLLSIVEEFSLISIMFEVASAFGTCGLSMGITPELTTLSKIILMMLMFIGRIGILTFLFTFKNERTKGTYHYPKEKIIIG
ncbi:TrkH family potassium uptake protein [Salirhabdus salicampi]|uniref:TrkH family potassium uptake protein n=1 Tax=Salirhabdus salicampi TaxID=476102 RepID=UPI0020C1F5B1|nr:TrkH family potassium uptake protein [Salirhabdus salicampi]MCP8615994.1 TrkH family potassium uptake protein [Salirhabdus salicampi]